MALGLFLNIDVVISWMVPCSPHSYKRDAPVFKRLYVPLCFFFFFCFLLDVPLQQVASQVTKERRLVSVSLALSWERERDPNWKGTRGKMGTQDTGSVTVREKWVDRVVGGSKVSLTAAPASCAQLSAWQPAVCCWVEFFKKLLPALVPVATIVAAEKALKMSAASHRSRKRNREWS